MERWRRRIGLAILGIIVVILVYTLLYQWAMSTFEGQNRTFFDALQVVIESLTTAGFGGDTAHWNSTQMNLLVIAMNLTGVLLVFLAIPLFAVPMFKEAFDVSLPESSSLTDHVIICGFSHRDEVLTGELELAGIQFLYVDNDPEVVRRLINRGIEAILGDAERIDALEAANIDHASAIVADINDEINPTVIISAKRANPDVRVLSVARLAGAAEYHRYAGADEVIEAPRALGESLGLRAVTSFAEKFREVLHNGEDLVITELLVEDDSALVGKTLREVDVFDENGVRVFGGWYGGRFLIPPDPDVPIAENSIFLVAGHHDLSGLTTRQLPTHHDDRNRVLICGYGVVGHAAAEILDRKGVPYDLLDIDPDSGSDIVGDVTDPETFVGADISEYRSVVLALDRDPTTIYATLILDRIAPHVEIIARVHDPDNVWKLYNAGADFVLSMSVITGEMLAAELIEETEILTPHDEFEFAEVPAGSLAGMTLSEADVRSRVGATVIAIERGDELVLDIGPDFAIESGDDLVIAGRPEALDRFNDAFGQTDGPEVNGS